MLSVASGEQPGIPGRDDDSLQVWPTGQQELRAADDARAVHVLNVGSLGTGCLDTGDSTYDNRLKRSKTALLQRDTPPNLMVGATGTRRVLLAAACCPGRRCATSSFDRARGRAAAAVDAPASQHSLGPYPRGASVSPRLGKRR